MYRTGKACLMLTLMPGAGKTAGSVFYGKRLLPHIRLCPGAVMCVRSDEIWNEGKVFIEVYSFL